MAVVDPDVGRLARLPRNRSAGFLLKVRLHQCVPMCRQSGSMVGYHDAGKVRKEFTDGHNVGGGPVGLEFETVERDGVRQ